MPQADRHQGIGLKMRVGERPDAVLRQVQCRADPKLRSIAAMPGNVQRSRRRRPIGEPRDDAPTSTMGGMVEPGGMVRKTTDHGKTGTQGRLKTYETVTSGFGPGRMVAADGSRPGETERLPSRSIRL